MRIFSPGYILKAWYYYRTAVFKDRCVFLSRSPPVFDRSSSLVSFISFWISQIRQSQALVFFFGFFFCPRQRSSFGVWTQGWKRTFGPIILPIFGPLTCNFPLGFHTCVQLARNLKKNRERKKRSRSSNSAAAQTIKDKRWRGWSLIQTMWREFHVSSSNKMLADPQHPPNPPPPSPLCA